MGSLVFWNYASMIVVSNVLKSVVVFDDGTSKFPQFIDSTLVNHYNVDALKGRCPHKISDIKGG